MSETRIAIRYAKPLMELAEEQKKLDVVKKDMEHFLALCQELRQFSLFLKNPIIKSLRKWQILSKMFSGKMDKLSLSIIEIMTRKSREFVLEDMAAEFIRLYNIKQGITKATVTTAVALDAKLKKQFLAIVEEVSGQKVELEEEVNPNIIGGFVLNIGDRMVDDSVSGKLRDIKYKLIKQ